MLASIHQPEHLPWMGLLHKISISDIYIVLDSVQFKKNYFENRNRIYTHQGLQWLTVPVKMVGHIEKTFAEIEVQPDWKRKYMLRLRQNYSKAPFQEDVAPLLECIDSWDGHLLVDLNLKIIDGICKALGINTQIIRASHMNVTVKKTELLVSILKEVGADSYIVGKSGFEYMDLSLFEAAKIGLQKHEFNHIRYQPFNYSEFTDFPSVIDVIANLGSVKVKEALG